MEKYVCKSDEQVEEDQDGMSLLLDNMENCILLDKITKSDGYGGYTTEWSEGAEFKAAIVLDSSIQARQAEKDGVTGLYTITTGREFNLTFHDVFRRLTDGKIFRVTTKGDDRKTPKGAALNMRQVNAEEFDLTEENNG